MTLLLARVAFCAFVIKRQGQFLVMQQNNINGLGWFVGSCLILVGFWLTGFYFLTGVSLALAGFFWWPPTRSRIVTALNLPPVPIFHVALTLVIFVIALFAFIGRYSMQLDEQAKAAGYENLEEWRAAEKKED